MQVRLTIDVPVQHLPGLERALQAQRLAIRPYIKNGVQRWHMLPAGPSSQPSLPDTLLAQPEVA